jgi:hypothetical protein
MKKILRIISILIFTGGSLLYAGSGLDETASTPEPAEEDTVEYGWTPKGIIGANLSQVALSNWAGGGENSLAYSFLADFGVGYLSPYWKFDSFLKLTYGQTKLGDDESKVTDNDLYFENVLSYDPGWVVKPFASLLIRSTVADGFEYDDTSKTQIKAFFDPGYVTETVGFVYDRPEWIQTRLGIAFQQTFTNKYRNFSDPDNNPPTEAFLFETGLESVTDVEYAFDENLVFVSKLRLFGRFEDLGWWDVRFDNTLVAKVTDLINVNLNVLLIYEKLQTPKTQLKEALQLGITYTIF